MDDPTYIDDVDDENNVPICTRCHGRGTIWIDEDTDGTPLGEDVEVTCLSCDGYGRA